MKVIAKLRTKCGCRRSFRIAEERPAIDLLIDEPVRLSLKTEATDSGKIAHKKRRFDFVGYGRITDKLLVCYYQER